MSLAGEQGAQGAQGETGAQGAGGQPGEQEHMSLNLSYHVTTFAIDPPYNIVIYTFWLYNI